MEDAHRIAGDVSALTEEGGRWRAPAQRNVAVGNLLLEVSLREIAFFFDLPELEVVADFLLVRRTAFLRMDLLTSDRVLDGARGNRVKDDLPVERLAGRHYP